MVHRLRIFPQRHFHRHRRAKEHFLDPPAVGFDRAQLTADRVCAARPGNHRGHAGLRRLRKTAVERVDRINRTKVRGGRIGILIAVVPLKAEAVLPHPHMGVGIDKAGQQKRAAGIKRILRRLLRRRHRAERRDASIDYIHIAVLNHRGVHRHDSGVYNAHRQNSSRT